MALSSSRLPRASAASGTGVATGRVAGMPAARHSSADFLAFMTRLAADYGPRRELHVILDNLSAHKTKAVEAWLAVHRHVRFYLMSLALQLEL